MKNCELCKKLATIYCESDHANLCWDCDLKVHSANFLVAKHSRTLLCHVCQSPTAWSAAGVKIGRTVSVCEKCINNEDEDDEDDVEEEEEEEIDDVEDIQVVPLSSTPPPPPPPSPPESSSSSGESLRSYGKFSLKRMREDDDDSGTSTSHREVDAPPVKMPSKIQRTEESLTGRVKTTVFLSKFAATLTLNE